MSNFLSPEREEGSNMKIKNKEVSCRTCQHSYEFAPNISSDVSPCHACRRCSNFRHRQYGDPEANRLIEEGKEIMDELCRFEKDVLGEKAFVEKCREDRELDDGVLRSFTTGATRDTAGNKLDYAGFLSPKALRQFAKYMNMNRLQSDGKLRDSDNWKKGIPMPVYVSSAFRHFWEWWETYRCENFNGDRDMTIKLMAALCGLMFNVQGFLHELLKIVDMVDFDGSEPTPEMKERQDATQKISKTKAS